MWTLSVRVQLRDDEGLWYYGNEDNREIGGNRKIVKDPSQAESVECKQLMDMVPLEREGYDASALCTSGPRQLCSCVQELDRRRRLLLEPAEQMGERPGASRVWADGMNQVGAELLLPRDPEDMCTPCFSQSLSEGGARNGRLRSCPLPGENYCSRGTHQERTLARPGKWLGLEIQKSAVSG